MKPVIALTTVGADFDIAPLASSLIDQRLAACVNIVSGIRSIYRWKGKVEDDRETLLIIKTTEERVDALREALFAQHPYEVPEFLVLPISDTSDAYGQWLAEQTMNDEG